MNLNNELLMLAAEFLDQYSDKLSNNSCNDYEFPSYISDETLELFKFEPEDPISRMKMDWRVADILAEYIASLIPLKKT